MMRLRGEESDVPTLRPFEGWPDRARKAFANPASAAIQTADGQCETVIGGCRDVSPESLAGSGQGERATKGIKGAPELMKPSHPAGVTTTAREAEQILPNCQSPF